MSEGLVALETEVLLDQRMAVPMVVEFGEGAVAVFSDVCPGASQANEDAALLVRYSDQEAVLAVADGAGGMPAGGEAAAAAVQALRGAVERARSEGQSLRAGILDGFDEGNQAVRALAVGAATTLAAVEIGPGYVRPYHAGDSSIVVVGQRGKVKLTTVPHSPVGYAVEAGLIAPEDALHHDDLNLVSNFVGGPGMRIEVGAVLKLAPRDTAIVATDGVFDNLHLEEVIALIRTGPLGQAAACLQTACATRMRQPSEGEPSKPDDTTFVLYRRSK